MIQNSQSENPNWILHDEPCAPVPQIINIHDAQALRPLDETLLNDLENIDPANLEAAQHLLVSYGLNPFGPQGLEYDSAYLIHLVKHLLQFRSKESQLEDLAPDLILRFLRFSYIPVPLCTNERVDEGMNLFDKFWLPSIAELENLSEAATNQLSVPNLRS